MKLENTESDRVCSTISSPLRKICPHHSLIEPLQALPPLHTFSAFDAMLELDLTDLLFIERHQFNYVCGVISGRRICTNSLYCQFHLLNERLAVPRPQPLETLIREEMGRRSLFEKRRRVVKIFHECQHYWRTSASPSQTPKTCSSPSCLDATLEESPRDVSACSRDSIHGGHEERYTLLRQAYLKKLARPLDSSEDERASYLYYRLGVYENVGLDVRTREIEARLELSNAANSLRLNSDGQFLTEIRPSLLHSQGRGQLLPSQYPH